MKRLVGLALLTISMGSALGGCAVHDERRCRHGFVPAHHDAWGRWHRGHCR